MPTSSPKRLCVAPLCQKEGCLKGVNCPKFDKCSGFISDHSLTLLKVGSPPSTLVFQSWDSKGVLSQSLKSAQKLFLIILW